MASHTPNRNKKGEIVSYYIRQYKGRSKDGKQLKPYSMTWKVPKGMPEGKVQKELKKVELKFEEECKNGFSLDNKQTFEQYANYVLELKERTGAKHKTIELYKRLLERINPAIGHLKLCEIRPQHLNKFYTELSLNGQNKLTGGKLSGKTILEHHRLISTILAQAEKEMLVIYNAASRATPPKNTRKDPGCLELEEVLNIKEYVKAEPLKWQVAMNLLCLTGCRRGEILGLQWKNVNLKDGLISIKNNLLYSKERGIYLDTPKTKESNRCLQIPQELVNLLKKYKAETNSFKLQIGGDWNKDGFLFTQENGKPMHPDSLTSYCYRFKRQINKKIEKYNEENNTNYSLIPHINPHLFRHTLASLLIEDGLDAATSSKMLGHSRISTTMDTYTHSFKKSMTKAKEKVEEIFSAQDKAVTPNL